MYAPPARIIGVLEEVARKKVSRFAALRKLVGSEILAMHETDLHTVLTEDFLAVFEVQEFSTDGYFFTNGHRAFRVVYCDDCDSTTVLEPREEDKLFFGIWVETPQRQYDATDNYTSFLAYRDRLARQGLTFPDIHMRDLPAFVKEKFDARLDLEQVLTWEWKQEQSD